MDDLLALSVLETEAVVDTLAVDVEVAVVVVDISGV